MKTFENLSGNSSTHLQSNEEQGACRIDDTPSPRVVPSHLQLIEATDRRPLSHATLSPCFPGLDYAGVCRPATDSPGDYVDVAALETGTIIFTIGERGDTVSPSSLPIHLVQHYLHCMIYLGESDPKLLARDMNSLIYDCCAENHLLTCFCAQYSCETKLLRYVNAGHTPPLLIRRNPDQVLHLEKGGPVFGLQESPRYAEGVVRLKTEDRLVAFTHGVIDSLASRVNDNAEAALIGLTRQGSHNKAAELANRILAEAETACETQFDRSVLVASVINDSSQPYASSAREEMAIMASV